MAYIKKNKPKKIRDDSDEYKKWRRAVMKRDKHRCQMPSCSKNAKQAHHIIRWSDSPYLRYVPDNGIALCYDCHKQVTTNESNYIMMFTRIVQAKKSI